MSQLSVVGAEWCPHSRNQAKALGCETDENGQTTCKANIDGTTNSVNFVYCQDKDRKPINQDHELCKNNNIKGYPAWLENGQVSETLGGFMNPCDVPGLNKNQLNCAAYENAQGICQKAQQDSQEAMKEFEEEYKTVALKIESAVEPHKQACLAAQEEAKPQW